MIKRKRSSEWVSTSEMAKTLGCSTRYLFKFMERYQFKKGRPWINLNPNGARPTYRWNKEKMLKLLGDSNND